MSNIETKNWDEFVIENLFDIHPTKAYKLTNAILLEEDGINPVVVNSSYNNGIGGYTNKKTTEPGNMITFSDTTTADAIFYQKNPFVGYAHVQGLYPIGKYKNKWTEKSLLFFVVIFKRKAVDSNYDYVNKFTRDLAKKLKVKLPVDSLGNPDFIYMEKYMEKLESKVKSSLEKMKEISQLQKSEIDVKKWKQFHIFDIFNIDSGTKLDKAKMDTSVEEINFVGRSNFCNGITQKVKRIDDLKPYESGCLTLALGGAYLGSCFVQPEPFYTSQNVSVLIPKNNISFFAKQFIASAIFKESQNNYQAFIKELNAHIKRDFIIKLPADADGNPDYEYMDKYMKNIEFKVKRKFDAMRSVINI